MDASRLADIVARGNGRAALQTGAQYTVLRPRGTNTPLATRNRIIRLAVCFAKTDTTDAHVGGFREAIFDTAYTKIGDYFTGSGDTLFIVSQQPGEVSRCILCNRSLRVTRAVAAVTGGYGGTITREFSALLSDWPARMLVAGGHVAPGRSGAARLAAWTVELPRLPVAPMVADVVTDDLGQAFSVGAVEESRFGWKLQVKQIGG